ncbi:hypothetical protein HanRHA438_Chr15g0709971 [Helianthus annuus]|nr:hypothetical protein HanXRQr2_Chr15g0685961 [Helianthus annuus]KAF5764937.1 hypothetical protein HanXRQr2_Chr15g0697781 [Helianthus annuus]KAF5785944.1 hypothetical protein HanXRQr2_Chr10g0434791 [Helianthus annuus]KAF5816413.1 hypothetical protein HanXRQr2_Chr03g0134051 [Helianthus annuus]KAF5821017.1 hypothetical protein HanXRQr2_Chr01g0008841 [Helianthus annuus]
MEAWNEAGQTEQVRKGKRNLDASLRYSRIMGDDQATFEGPNTYS